MDQGTSIRTACSCFLGLQSLEGSEYKSEAWKEQPAGGQDAVRVTEVGVLAETSVQHKTEQKYTISGAPLHWELLEEKESSWDRGLCCRRRRGIKKSFWPSSQLAVSYLVPRMGRLSRRQPCGRRRQPESCRVCREPRGNLPAAPTGWAGQEEAVGTPGCCTPCLGHLYRT